MRDLLASALLAMIIILFAGQSVAGSLDLWLNVQALTTREPQAQRVASDVFSYMREREGLDAPKIDGFSSKENSHMADVKWTFRVLESLLFVSWWIFIALLLFSARRASIFVRGSCLAMADLLILLVVPFDSLFVWFHQVFFSPGSWTFSGGLMISSFPGAFFVWLAQLWWMRAFSAGLALAFISFIVSKREKTTTLI